MADEEGETDDLKIISKCGLVGSSHCTSSTSNWSWRRYNCANYNLV